jgi:hypothetical protein
MAVAYRRVVLSFCATAVCVWSDSRAQCNHARKRTYRPRPGEEHEEQAKSVPYSAERPSAGRHPVRMAYLFDNMEILGITYRQAVRVASFLCLLLAVYVDLGVWGAFSILRRASSGRVLEWIQ